MRYYNKQKIDYSSIPSDLKDSNVHGWSMAWVFILGIPLALMIVIAVIGLGNEDIYLFLAWVFLLGLPAALLVAYLLQARRVANKNNYNFLPDFAKDNNFVYLNREVIKENGSIFYLSNSVNSGPTKLVAINMLLGKFDDTIPFRYYVIKGIDDSSKIISAYGGINVLEITLPENSDHFFINSKLEGIGRGGTSIVPVMNYAEKITLEGDFSKYFVVHIEQGSNITALSFLAPNIMETIMEFGIDSDVELVGNKIYFYYSNVAESRRDYALRFESIKILLTKIWHKHADGIPQLSIDKHSSENNYYKYKKILSLAMKNYKTILFFVGLPLFMFFYYNLISIDLYSSDNKYGVNYFSSIRPFLITLLTLSVVFVIVIIFTRKRNINKFKDYKKNIDKSNVIINNALNYRKNDSWNYEEVAGEKDKIK